MTTQVLAGLQGDQLLILRASVTCLNRDFGPDGWHVRLDEETGIIYAVGPGRWYKGKPEQQGSTEHANTPREMREQLVARIAELKKQQEKSC